VPIPICDFSSSEPAGLRVSRRCLGTMTFGAHVTQRAATRSSIRTSPPQEGTRFTLRNAGARYQARYWHEREFATIESLRKVAQEAGMSMVALAVAWVLSNPVVTAPIVGASHPEQLADSLAAAEKGGVSPDLMARLDELTRGWRAVDADR
jgi:aryl-alcohol dehydrogenase-like predicted oxidoreductase